MYKGRISLDNCDVINIPDGKGAFLIEEIIFKIDVTS